MRNTTTGLAAFAFVAVVSLQAAAKPFGIMLTASSIDHTDKRVDAPIFRDAMTICALERRLGVNPYRRPKGFPEDFLERVPDSDRRKAPYALADFATKVVEGDFSSAGGTRFMLSIAEARPPYMLSAGGYPLADRAGYAAWKAAHPNFMGFLALAECDSDFSYLYRYRSCIRYPEIGGDLQGRFPKGQPSDGRGRHFNWVMRAAAEAREFHFGETNLWMMCSNYASYCHLFAAAGACGVFYEATSQGPASWTLAAAYARGASRQFGIPFAWYCAHYYSGYSRDGRKLVGENRWAEKCLPPTAYRAARPHRGASRSLLSRQAHLGWLAGAVRLQMEHWERLFTMEKDGRRVLSPEGEDFDALYALSRKLDAGDPITPLAVLVPFAEPLDTQLRFTGEFRDKTSQKTIFRELVRSPETDDVLENRIRGEQGCLHNSPHACMYDVLCPDAGQSPASFLRALKRYPYALLAGFGFDERRLDAKSLAEYVRGGGTLVVTDEGLARRFTPAAGAKGRVLHVPCEREALGAMFARIQGERLPVKVAGDCLFGENKVADGYLVWIFNNNGVEKYCDEPEKLDESKTSHVELSRAGKTLAVDVPPGGIKLVEWKESAGEFRVVSTQPVRAVAARSGQELWFLAWCGIIRVL